MANYARIINDVAVDVSSDPAKFFHPVVAAEFQAVPDEVQQGWTRIDGTWTAPEPTAESDQGGV